MITRPAIPRPGAPAAVALDLALGIVAPAAAAGPAEVRTGVSAAQLFALADRAQQLGKPSEAAMIYTALEHDPDADIRSEARFRLGVLLAKGGRYRDAAIAFRRVLDEKPDAAGVRLALARVLAQMDDERGAREQLRQAQASGLPADVAAMVDQFVAALASRRPWGGGLGLSLAPDSNINRATNAKTLETVLAPLTLDRTAQSQSGLGLKTWGQAYGRWDVQGRVALLAQASADASLYRQSAFNDISIGVTLGPEFTAGGDRWRPALGLTRRYYGDTLYAATQSVSVNWLHPAGRRSQVGADLSWNRVRYAQRPQQDGAIVSARLAWDHAFDSRTGASLTLSASRQTAQDPAYATASAGLGVLVWRESGRSTLFGTAAVNGLGGDARQFPFTERRQDQLYRAVAGVKARRWAVGSFVPVVRLVAERNHSTVAIYDYRRASVEIGVDRSF